NALHGLDHDEDRFAEALKEQGSSREEFDKDARENAEKAVKTQLLVDAIADMRRGKALAVVVHGATVKDTTGETVDTEEFFGPRQEEQPATEAEEPAN